MEYCAALIHSLDNMGAPTLCRLFQALGYIRNRADIPQS